MLLLGITYAYIWGEYFWSKNNPYHPLTKIVNTPLHDIGI